MKNKINKDKIKKFLTEKFHQLQNLSPEKQRILGATATIPIIAAGTISGACAAGCPYGMVNCPYPGQCGRYFDANGDGLCDLSQTTTTTTTDTSSQDTSTQDTSSADTSTPSTVDTTSTGTDNSNGLQEMGGNANGVEDTSSSGLDGSLPSDDGTNYHILPVTLILLGGYLFTYYLFKKGILKPQQHKRLWNLLVTFGYVGTGITGVLLTVMINMGISTAYNQGLTYWHAELSILMVVATLLHLHIYWKPFKKMFKVLFGFKGKSTT